MREKTLLSTTKIQLTKVALFVSFLFFGLTVSAQFSESFDNTTIPAGWQNYPSGGGSTSSAAYWKFSGNPGYGMAGTQDHTGNGGSYTWVDGSYPYGQSAHLATDSINMSAYINPALTFWMKRNNITNTTRQVLHIDVWNGTAWVYDLLVQQDNTVNGDWEMFTVNIDTVTIASQTSIRFRLDKIYNNFYDDVAIDDIGMISVLPDDAGATAVLNPILPACTLDSVVIAEFKNFGSDSLTSVSINWSINGSVQAPYLWVGGIESGAFDTVTLATNATLAFGDTIDVWTSLPNGVTDQISINDSTRFDYIAGLSGVKTIDPAGTGDFLSFTEAINALEQFGVCGNLIIEAVDTTYVEQISISTFDGQSPTNTVTFRSQSGDQDGVILAYSATGSTDNYVVEFDGASFVTFADMTIRGLGASYGRTVTTPTTGGNHHITINNCVLEGIVTTSSWSSGAFVTYIYGADNDNWTVTNNTFLNGNYGLYFYGNFNSRNQSNVISNNEFIDQYYRSAYLYYQNDVVFNNNHTVSNSTYTSGYAFSLGQLNGGQVQGNFIEGSSTWPRYGLYLSSVSGALNTFLPVVNNRIYMPSSSASYGMYISGNLFVEFSHNSLLFGGASSSGRAIYMSSGGYNVLKNNIIQNTGAGYGIYTSSSPIYIMDYNNISVPNGNVGYSGSNQATLADWTAATGFDSNSLSVNDIYSDSATLKVCTDSLYGQGIYLPLYSADFEGDLRQNPPCIGADEFMPISLFGFTDSPVLCTGDTIVLRQDYYDTVVWNSIDTSNVYMVTNPGQVTVEVFDGCGSASSTFDVVPQEVSTLGDTNLCEGTSAVLSTGISGGTYLWNNGSTDSTMTVDSAQVLNVQIIDAFGCASVATSIVTQSMDVVLNDVDSFCQGSNGLLDANMTGTYIWSDGSTNQTLSVTSPGAYSVTVTDQNCVSSDTTMVNEILNAIPAFTDSSSYLTVVFTNASQNANSYLWDFGDGTTSTDENPTHVYPWTPDSVLLYTATLTAYNSCGDNEFVNDGIRVGQLVSVSEIDLASMISVYPNPNNGVFNVVVKTDEAATMNIEVLDVRGSLVYTNSFGTVNGEVNRTINLEGAAQGIYFVKVTLNGETAVYRLSVN